MTEDELKAVEARLTEILRGDIEDVERAAGIFLEVHGRSLLAEVRELRRNLALALDAGQAAEMRIVELKSDQAQGGKDYCALQDRSDAWQVRALNAEDEVSRLRRAIGHWVKNAREYGAAAEADIYKLESVLSSTPVCAPRYSTGAVDRALDAWDQYCANDPEVDEFVVGKFLNAVRASREPKP